MPATLAIYCLTFPFWSLPILPGVFKPIAVLVAAVISLKFFGNFRTRVVTEDLFLLSYLIYSLALTFIYSMFTPNSIAIDKLILFLFGIFASFGTREVFVRVKPDQITSAIIWCPIILVPIFFVESFSMLKLLPWDWKQSMNIILNGKGSSRIVLTAGEPSWAGILFLVLFPFVYYKTRLKKSFSNRFLLIFVAVGFFVSFSISAYLSAFTAAFLFAVIRGKFMIFMKIVCISVLFITGFFLVVNYGFDEHFYFTTRFIKFTDLIVHGDLDINSLLAIDGSVLIRFIYPAIAVETFMQNPIGFGVGNFGYEFAEQLNNFGYSQILQNEQILSHLDNHNADARNFFLHVANDSGVIGLSIMTLYYWHVYRRIRDMVKNDDLYDSNYVLLLQMGFCITIGCMLQFATYLFPLYSLIPALVIGYHVAQRKIS